MKRIKLKNKLKLIMKMLSFEILYIKKLPSHNFFAFCVSHQTSILQFRKRHTKYKLHIIILMNM